MRLLAKRIHPEAEPLENKSILKRLATRAIVIKGDNILLLYTQRYEDYSLPGGGVDEGEDVLAGFARELAEETGARDIQNINEFGIYEEIRPWYRPEHDLVHMISYCYTCNISDELEEPQYEEYEKNNGMKALWVNIHKAIEHNEKTLMESEKKGLSIEREIFLLKLIRDELFLSN